MNRPPFSMFALAAALTTAGLALPAQAESPFAAATPAPVPSVPTGKVAHASQRYCVVTTVTGSRVPRRTCQTRDAWMKQGFDPLAAK